ncbi:Complex III subunit 8 [Saitozyma sp. JCM 24511]|nr:Complex III subunit 8 [Saitozyma sp. JCM 24511]
MRPTQIVQSGMPGGKTYMGWWGDMGGPRQKGIVQYTLSPFKQKAMRGVFQGYLFNGFRRIMAQVPYFALPFAGGYAVYIWGSNNEPAPAPLVLTLIYLSIPLALRPYPFPNKLSYLSLAQSARRLDDVAIGDADIASKV